MSLIDLLDSKEAWEGFFQYKQEKGHLAKQDEEALTLFISSEDYHQVAASILKGEAFSPPQKILINKLGTAKKRVVYSFSNQEMWMLKLLSWLLYRYDDKQPAGCYSFRRNLGVHRAFRDITRTPGIDQHWCCKLDINDYFNSIQIPRMLNILSDVLSDDRALFSFFKQMLSSDVAYFNGELVSEKRGVMAGTPTAPFLANLYLRELDEWFKSRNLPYARYSDDIIIFARTEEEINHCRRVAEGIISNHGLSINKEKEYIAAPGEAWEFLGMSYSSGTIDLSEVTKTKLKGKIRRKARALRRWMIRKNATAERAQRAFIRSFNRKFFENTGTNDLTWSRWFFPLLTTSESLCEIDHYLQQYIRYIATGRFNGANYRLDYQSIKELGFRSLVHEYYLSRKNRFSYIMNTASGEGFRD